MWLQSANPKKRTLSRVPTFFWAYKGIASPIVGQMFPPSDKIWTDLWISQILRRLKVRSPPRLGQVAGSRTIGAQKRRGKVSWLLLVGLSLSLTLIHTLLNASTSGIAPRQSCAISLLSGWWNIDDSSSWATNYNILLHWNLNHYGGPHFILHSICSHPLRICHMFSSKEIVIRTKTTVFVATLLLQAVVGCY